MYYDTIKEIKDEKPRDDLSKVLQVQIGIATERVNLDFLQYDIEQEVFRNITVDPDNKNKWMRRFI